jgi:hypothetical protein
MAYTTIDDPSAYFQATLYTGNGGTLAVTNDGNSDLQPDWVWTKKRSGSSHHALVDSSRGASKQIYSNLTAAEETVSGVSGFNTNGFTLGSNGTANANGATFVAWQWKANGGTTASNTAGTITSTVQANTTAGISIFTYTGTGSAGTVGHGLGGLPDLIIYKGRNTTSNWPVYVDPQKDGTLQFPKLNGTDGNVGNSPFTWDTTKFTFSSGSSYSNTSGTNYIAYAFRSIQGYSKIGSYIGNGNVDGPFVYTGFKPAFILFKHTGASTDWMLYDNKVSPRNVVNRVLYPSGTYAEGGGDATDFLSNGFKQYSTGGSQNTSGQTYIYMAFAEQPFVTSTGVPATAR